MLSGLSEDNKKKYGLSTAEKYFYLNQVSLVAVVTSDIDTTYVRQYK